MFIIALNVIFNAFILALILLIGTEMLHFKPYLAWIFGYLITASLAILGYTKFASSIMALFLKGRIMISRENEKLEPLFQNVIDKTNHRYNTNYTLKDFNIKVSDNKVIDTMSLGYNNIIINRGALEKLTNHQLRAVLAGQMGHMYYRDSVRNSAMMFSSLGSRIIIWLYGIYLTIATFMKTNFNGKNSRFLAFAMCIPLILFLPVIILNYLGSRLFKLLSQKLNRESTYRADTFTSSIGYKADLISALEVLDSTTIYDNSLKARLMATKPSVMSRIGALEDAEIPKEKLGGVAKFFVATNDSSLGSNTEVVRLCSILGIVGVVWLCLITFI